MRIHDIIREYRDKEGPGVTSPPPQEGVKRFFFLISSHFFKLIGLNFLFIVFCLPIVTIPASLSALSYVCLRFATVGQSDVFQDFWKEFRLDFFRRMIPGLLLLLLPVGIALLCNFLITPLLGAGIGIILFACLFIVQCYLYPLWASIDIPVRKNIKNAFILFVSNPRTDLLFWLVPGVFIILTWLFLPYTLPVLLLFLFSFVSLATCLIAFPVTKTLIKNG